VKRLILKELTDLKVSFVFCNLTFQSSKPDMNC
jgi:hypothetical protein